MQIQQRIQAFVQLGLFIQVHFLESSTDKDLEWFEKWEKVKKEAYTYNNWFIPKFVQESIMNIAEMLNEKELNQFASVFKTDKNPKTVAIICAGNIPMVAFHDIMMTLLSGNKALVKTSSDDPILIPFLFRLLIEIEPQFKDFISFADGKLEKFDAVIATGSNNTSSHFEYYFSKYPNIIRKNRSSVAVLNGDESDEELKALGKDVFSYFGLGCRNVSQLLVPENYNFDKFFEAIFDFGFLIENKKYGNN
ncbi:MAG: acyl-CoA reductase, partial [Bacteroidia bacterium]